MATRIYALGVGGRVTDVQENIGPTATSAIVALVIDLATTGVTEGGTTRGPTRNEVLLAIENLKQYLLADNWPPA